MSRNIFLRKISATLRASDAIPLFGHVEAFNWTAFSEHLSSALAVEGLTCRRKAQSWKEGDLLANLGPSPSVTALTLSPLETPFYFALSKTDRSKLTSRLFATPKLSAALQEGYFRYLLLEACHAASSLETLRHLTLQLGDQAAPPEESALCIDVEIEMDEETAWGRIILPTSFRAELTQHFAAFPPKMPFHATTPLAIHLHVGTIALSPKEWKKLKKEDVLLPDTFHPQEPLFALPGQPLFRTHLTQNQLTLVEYAFTPQPLKDSMSLAEHLENAEPETKNIRDVPMQVHVEIARLKIPLNELMGLEPGNTLELPPYAEKKMLLTVNGEKIGVAELVQLGSTLGLRILEC